MDLLKVLCNLLKLSKDSLERYIREEKIFQNLSLDKKKEFVLKYIEIRDDININKDIDLINKLCEILKI